jgi:hypothetical protein
LTANKKQKGGTTSNVNCISNTPGGNGGGIGGGDYLPNNQKLSRQKIIKPSSPGSVTCAPTIPPHSSLLNLSSPHFLIDLSSSPSQLLSAVRAANETLVPSLLEQHALLLNVCDSHGVSPLIAAAGLSNPELSQKFTALLLQAGADDSLCDNSGRTAWHWAAIAGHASTVATLASFRARKAVQPQVLLAQDPDCSLENLTGPALQCVKAACEQIDKSMRTAFHWACIFGREACLKLLKFFSHPFVPSDVLAGVGHATLDDGRPCEERQGRKIVFSAVPNLRTLVLHHPDCKRHGDVTHQGQLLL